MILGRTKGEIVAVLTDSESRTLKLIVAPASGPRHRNPAEPAALKY
jgi:hypothetical protein